MREDIRFAFEAAAPYSPTKNGREKSPKALQAEVNLFIKRVELLIENLPDQTMSLIELYQEIAGSASDGEME